MCDSIRFKNGEDVGTIRQFQEFFKTDAVKYGFNGDEQFLDFCMCSIDLKQFFKENPEHKFYYEWGEWWEGEINEE